MADRKVHLNERGIKQMARELKGTQGISHTKCLEVIARSLGFKTYAALKAAHFPTNPEEKDRRALIRSNRSRKKFAVCLDAANVDFDNGGLEKTPIATAIASIKPGMEPIDRTAVTVVFRPYSEAN